MIIAKPEWFKRRKTDIFGAFGYPWQGTAYITLIFLLAVGVVLSEDVMTKITVMMLFLFLFINGLIAYQKSLDERQVIHHAIVYRNTFLGIYITYVIILVIQLNYNLNNEDIFNLIKLSISVGCLIAIITYYQLDKGKLKIEISHKIANNIRNMIISRSKWFKRKNKSNYWILDISWKGTAYILILFLLGLSVGYIPGGTIVTIISILLFLFLTIGYLIAFTKAMDERQQINYAITYRNAFWGMVITFIMIQPVLFTYNLNPEDTFGLSLLPLCIGFLIAIITHYKLQRELLFL